MSHAQTLQQEAKLLLGSPTVLLHSRLSSN